MRDPKLIYNGTVKDGVIKLPSTRLKKEVCSVFDGKNIVVEFKRKRKRRSKRQNDYYWAVVIPHIVAAMIDLGNNLQIGNKEHAESVHKMLKDDILQNGEELVLHEGIVKKMPPTTTKLTTVEMMEYIDRVAIWAGEYLNIKIPQPNEKLEIF